MNDIDDNDDNNDYSNDCLFAYVKNKKKPKKGKEMRKNNTNKFLHT